MFAIPSSEPQPPQPPHSVAILAQVSSIIPFGDFRAPWAVVLWCFAEALLVQSMCARSLDLCKHGRALLGSPSGCETVLPQFDGAGGGQPWMTVFFGSFVLLLCVLLPPSAQCVLYVFVVSCLVRTEWFVMSVFNVAMLAALVCAATLFVSFTLGGFQSVESLDGGLGPHLPKWSGLALFAAMVPLLHLVSGKILVIGAQKGRNEGRGVLVKPSALLCCLRTLQVCLVPQVPSSHQWSPSSCLQQRCHLVARRLLQQPRQLPVQPRLVTSSW